VNGSFAQLAGDNNSITAVNNSWCQRYWEHNRAISICGGNAQSASGATGAVIDHHATSLAWALKLRQDLPPITSDVNGHLGGVKCPGGLELDKQTPIA
jgi:hypothetical protein